MPYIPEEHKKYPVLPLAREMDFEVFQYSSREWPTKELEQFIGDRMIPYACKSYEAYFEEVDHMIEKHSGEPDTVRVLQKIKQHIKEWNKKEDWSICKYIGEDDEPPLGLQNGGYYYWPCRASDPKFSGVIDGIEFTGYLYPTDPELWEIVVDPTGMAYRTIYEEDSLLWK